MLVSALLQLSALVHAEEPDARLGLVLRAPTTVAPIRLRPGTTLTAEVRVVAALTPPPGVQQPRALRDWSARLIGIAPGAPGTVHEYRLMVSSVRPITSNSLNYRVHVPLPAWLAPGVYTLAITGPGGEATQPGAVSIVRDDVGDGATRIWLASGVKLRASLGARFFPATTVGLPTQPPAVIGLLPSGASLPPTTRAEATVVFVEVEPQARAGFAATLHARGLPSGATVAWSLSDGTSAYGAPQLKHLFEASGPFDGDLMAIGPDGAMTQVHFQVDVAPGMRLGCDSLGRAGSGATDWLGCPLILALPLLKRRPRCRAGISSPS